MMKLIFASAWIGGLIQLRKASSQSSRFLSLGNAFAAAIFLGIGLIHMLSGASDMRRTDEWLQRTKAKNGKTNYDNDYKL